MSNKILELLLGKSSQGVYLAEMERAPKLTEHPDRLEVTLWASTMNSMLAIDKVDHAKDGDAVVLSATQSLVTSIGNPRTFTIARADLGRYGALRWRDPDGKVHPLVADALA